MNSLPTHSAPQRLFRYEDGHRHCPDWMCRMAKTPVEANLLAAQWLPLVAYVANTANESGFFDPLSADWLKWSGMEAGASLLLTIRFTAAGGIVRVEGRLYVAGWRETYRLA